VLEAFAKTSHNAPSIYASTWSSSVRGIRPITVRLRESRFGDPVCERLGAVKRAFYGRDNNTRLVNLTR
jgi:hypothetical protein